MVVGVRVESENITTGAKKHCNSSYFTMVAKDANGKNIRVPGLILETEQGVRRFARSIQRKAEASLRSNRFEPSKFIMAEHLERLKDENVKLNLEVR